jgi:hypothetical protein
MGEDPKGAAQPLTDAALRAEQERRFQQRVARVIEFMRQQGVDFRGIPLITQDGRIGARVVPVPAPVERPDAPDQPE